MSEPVHTHTHTHKDKVSNNLKPGGRKFRLIVFITTYPSIPWVLFREGGDLGNSKVNLGGREGGRASSVEDAFQNSPEWWGQQVLYVPWDKEADTGLGWITYAWDNADHHQRSWQWFPRKRPNKYHPIELTRWRQNGRVPTLCPYVVVVLLNSLH